MSKILVSLVSDQTIPNLQLIKEFSFIDKYLFISSPEMERLGKRQWIIDAAGITPEKLLETVIIQQHSFDDIESHLKQYSLSDEDELFVNITGGTKVMSLVAFEFFKDLKSEIYYITGNKEEYIKVFPKSRNRIRHLTSSLTLNEYLVCYGFKPLIREPILYPEITSERFYRSFVSGEAHDPLQTLYALKRDPKRILVSRCSGLSDLLDDIGFPFSDDHLSKDDIEYLTGGWLEEMVYSKVKKELSLDDDFIGLNVILEKKNQRNENVRNEFDVLFLYQNKLHIIECKTSIFINNKKSIIGDVIYKSDSLQKGLGLFANTSIITCSRIMNDAGVIRDSFKDHMKRAELNKIKLITFENDFLNNPITPLLGIS